MRHKGTRSRSDLWRRVRRAAAHQLGEVADHLPVRTLTTLVVAMSLGIGGYVGLTSVMLAPTAGQSETALDTGSRGAERPSQDPQTPDSQDPSDPETGSSASGQPQAPPRSSDVTRSASGDPDETTGSPSPENTTPWTDPSQTDPDAARPVRDDTPPSTTLTENVSAPDRAMFRLSANEEASFTCSLDGAAYSSCESPMRYTDLDPGWHTFAARAVDTAGNTDPTPAETRWLVR